MYKTVHFKTTRANRPDGDDIIVRWKLPEGDDKVIRYNLPEGSARTVRAKRVRI